MDIGGIVLIVALLACPLMMLLIHRGMKRREGEESPRHDSLSELRRARDELDATIRAREESGAPESERDRAAQRPSDR